MASFNPTPSLTPIPAHLPQIDGHLSLPDIVNTECARKSDSVAKEIFKGISCIVLTSAAIVVTSLALGGTFGLLSLIAANLVYVALIVSALALFCFVVHYGIKLGKAVYNYFSAENVIPKTPPSSPQVSPSQRSQDVKKAAEALPEVIVSAPVVVSEAPKFLQTIPENEKLNAEAAAAEREKDAKAAALAERQKDYKEQREKDIIKSELSRFFDNIFVDFRFEDYPEMVKRFEKFVDPGRLQLSPDDERLEAQREKLETFVEISKIIKSVIEAFEKGETNFSEKETKCNNLIADIKTSDENKSAIPKFFRKIEETKKKTIVLKKQFEESSKKRLREVLKIDVKDEAQANAIKKRNEQIIGLTFNMNAHFSEFPGYVKTVLQPAIQQHRQELQRILDFKLAQALLRSIGNDLVKKGNGVKEKIEQVKKYIENLQLILEDDSLVSSEKLVPQLAALEAIYDLKQELVSKEELASVLEPKIAACNSLSLDLVRDFGIQESFVKQLLADAEARLSSIKT